MQGWHTTFLGMRGLPRDISDFEMKAFFTFDGAERDAINARRGDAHKLGLALHIGFLRMSGRLLYAFRVVPVALWRHLSEELGIATPDVASLRTLYGREKTLFDHQQHWDSLVHLAASVMSGHASAVAALARFGSAAQGDPIYDAGVQLGRLLRTAFLADYFVKDAFRNELRRVLNRGEAVNALKRAIYTGRISPAQAKRVDEMQAVADALSLLANIVMAWNTSQMQAVLDRWSNRRQAIPPELIGKIAPTRLESINLRGVFRFPVDRYADQILPSRQGAPITGTNG
eukprot:gene36053-46854_t